MDNLHLSVIAVVLYFSLPGSVGIKSQQILLDTHNHSDCWWDWEFSVNCSFTGLSLIPEDVFQMAITADFSYNNIKTFLHTDKGNEEWMLKHLNLSNNLISELSLTTFRNLPILETLNLNDNAIHTLTLDIPMPAHGSQKYGKHSHLLPALKVLSVERNNLNTVPRGLGLLQSLHTVHFSSNGIRQIDLNDFQNCSQLKDIDLQNNKITEINPEAFRNLNKLQVVNLRGNALTTPLPQILISLNFFQLEVGLSNNAWIFNCRLNTFKHLFHFLFDSTRQTWSISYNQSANNSQKPLLYLSSFHLNCSNRVLLRTAVIPAEKKSVLECDLDNTRGNQVSWWTPRGKISKGNNLHHVTLDKVNNLVIHNAEKTAKGLYMCIFNTTKKKYLIYNIEVKEEVSTFLVRKARDTNAVLRQGRTEQDFALAVCLSVLITFACAFCLGAFARPYLGSLWRLMCRKKNSGSEHIYSNQAFSDETLSRECSASKATHTQRDLFISDGNSTRNTCVLPTETSALYENVTGSHVPAPNTEEYQKQSNNEINVKKKTAFSDIKTRISSDEDVNLSDNGLLSVRVDNKNSNEVMPRKLSSNDIALQKGSKFTNNEDSEKSRFPPKPKKLNADYCTNHTVSSYSDLSFMGETGFPFSTIPAHTVAEDSRNSKISSNSGLLQSESIKAAPDSPERKGIISHNEPMSTTKYMPGRQSCEQPGLNGNINTTSDVGDVILPSSCKRDTNIENLSVYQTIENSPLTEYDCKTEHTNERGTSADMFDDSSSDEGTPFTLSDCSSLADFELEEPDVSDNLPVCQSPPEEVNKNSGTEKFSTLPESPNIATELQHIGKNEDKKITINFGSDTSMPEIVSPYVDKCSDHINMSDSDTVSSSSQEVPDTLGYFTKEESTGQNSISNSLHNQSTDFSNMLLSLKDSPTYDTGRESTPEEAELQLYQWNHTEPQHSLSFSPTEQEGNTPEGSTDEHTERNSSEKNNSEGDITLRRNTSTSEDDDFIFAPIDIALNEIVKKTLLLRSSDESSLQSLPEQTAEKHFRVTSEKDDLLPEGKQVNTTKTCADKMQGGFNEKNRDGYMELEDTSNSSLPEETQSCNLMADLLHLHSSEKTQSVFNIDHFQLDQSDKDAHSFSVPQGFHENTPYSSFLEKTTGNIISKSTDSRKMDDDTTWTGLDNHSTTAASLQNSSEKLSQKGQTNVGQGQFFVKKKRAFDGFAHVLQSRRTDFSS
ncbi:leucine-rich repeat-containing protein 66 [Apus apus]|uniref:leucine-rich repeat-containing protein 66 n=1 Tax=Apus apus TaxID=8895 RepID=UPI0021F856DF|nr:leucine-rich repeat-containing protein 66 [Apus apus]XP_051473583.1 leucine-rich repeat-containing protein 66 [Apus apus]